MIYWAQLLHFYQPPTQTPFFLDKVCRESYEPLMRIFRHHPHIRATVNINGCLVEMLHEQGKEEVLRSLKSLAEEGRIEFTGSGQHHPILPLIPEEEVERQIQQNATVLGHHFGCRPRGFFPPEMAYSPGLAGPILGAGHEWVILSGIACPGDWPLDFIPEVEVEGKKLAVFFRDDVRSNRISFRRARGRDFLAGLENTGRETAYVITAMDAETFGHHNPGWEEEFLGEAYAEMGAMKGEREVRAVKVSELLDRFPRRLIPQPKPSSWSTTSEDLKAGAPFPLWQDPGNEIHRLQWGHLKICLDLVREAQRWAQEGPSREHAAVARGLLDRALHSDQFWWASRRPWWGIDLILKGLEEQWGVVVHAYKSLSSSQAPSGVMREGYSQVVASRDIRSRLEDLLFKG